MRPISFEWWFVTAYILLILVCPIINQFIQKLSKKGFLFFLLFVWLIYYSCDYVFKSEYIHLIRAFFFYICGTFFGFYCKIDIKKSRRFICIFLCVLSCIFMTFTDFIDDYLNWDNLIGKAKFICLLEDEINHFFERCVFIPLFSICLFRLFVSLKMGTRPFINKIASTTFGIYLIHESLLGREIIWNHIFNVSENQFTSAYFPLFAIADILIVFIVCSVIDILRQKFIEPRYLKLEEKFETEICKTKIFRT